MICLLAGSYQEAVTFARGQLLANNEWFYPQDLEDLYKHSNFHVLVIGSAGQNVSPQYFERVYQLAQTRGRIGRF